MDQKAYGVMLRGELPYAALSLTPRNLDDSAYRGHDYGTGCSASGASCTSRTRQQDEARVEGGA
eukprot:3130802-Pleurochrysis_carterae.AAC.1